MSSYIVFHPKRNESIVNFDGKNEIFWHDSLKGNQDPYYADDNGMLYSFCWKRFTPELKENDIVFFVYYEESEENWELFCDTVFIVNKKLIWKIDKCTQKCFKLHQSKLKNENKNYNLIMERKKDKLNPYPKKFSDLKFNNNKNIFQDKGTWENHFKYPSEGIHAHLDGNISTMVSTKDSFQPQVKSVDGTTSLISLREIFETPDINLIVKNDYKGQFPDVNKAKTVFVKGKFPFNLTTELAQKIIKKIKNEPNINIVYFDELNKIMNIKLEAK